MFGVSDDAYERGRKESLEVNMQGLVEGRVVHYVAYNDRHLAAIVIGGNFSEGVVDLGVFTNMQNTAGTKNLGLNFHPDIAYDPDKKPGTWHWIERTE